MFNLFESQSAKFFEEGIHSFRARWRRVIDNNREYLFDSPVLCFYNKIYFYLKMNFPTSRHNSRNLLENILIESMPDFEGVLMIKLYISNKRQQ